MIVKSGRRICGTGAALANAPLVQDKSYFEMKVQCGGTYIFMCVYIQTSHYQYINVEHLHSNSLVLLVCILNASNLVAVNNLLHGTNWRHESLYVSLTLKILGVYTAVICL